MKEVIIGRKFIILFLKEADLLVKYRKLDCKWLNCIVLLLVTATTNKGACRGVNSFLYFLTTAVGNIANTCVSLYIGRFVMTTMSLITNRRFTVCESIFPFPHLSPSFNGTPSPIDAKSWEPFGVSRATLLSSALSSDKWVLNIPHTLSTLYYYKTKREKTTRDDRHQSAGEKNYPLSMASIKSCSTTDLKFCGSNPTVQWTEKLPFTMIFFFSFKLTS